MKLPRLGFFVLVLKGIACSPQPAPLSDAGPEELERSVRAAVDGFADAERQRDVDAILGFIAPDFYMYVDGARADYETVVDQIRSTMPSLQSFETTWSNVEVTILAPDHALVTMVFQDVVTDGEGVTNRARGPTTFVWRLRDGVWRIIYADADHYPDAS
ncbi:MAG TPA: nuclear transport factor 2 family protein [Vicinamibacteria bacterium]|nr:nuclear transport factor 2 family protein [Vicinamibacteria bacterium]